MSTENVTGFPNSIILGIHVTFRWAPFGSNEEKSIYEHIFFLIYVLFHL